MRGWAAVTLAALLVTFQLLPTTSHGYVQRTLFDACHGPAFGLFALAALLLIESLTGRRDSVLLYVAALFVASGFGLFTEALQIFSPRNADVLDLWHNLDGAAAAMLLAAGLRRARRHPLVATLLAIAGVLLVLSTTAPALRLGWALARRNVDFPQLVDFADLPSPLVTVRAAGVEAGTFPDGTPGTRVTFRPAHYPALILELPYPDWRGYDVLAFDVYSELDGPVQLHVRIDDVRHVPGTEEEWYFERFPIEPGIHHVRIPLASVRRGPPHREMDMSHVRMFMIYLISPPEAQTLTIGPVRLEREDGSESSRLDVKPIRRIL